MLALLALAVLSPSPHDVGAPTATPDAIRPRVACLPDAELPLLSHVQPLLRKHAAAAYDCCANFMANESVLDVFGTIDSLSDLDVIPTYVTAYDDVYTEAHQLLALQPGYIVPIVTDALAGVRIDRELVRAAATASSADGVCPEALLPYRSHVGHRPCRDQAHRTPEVQEFFGWVNALDAAAAAKLFVDCPSAAVHTQASCTLDICAVPPDLHVPPGPQDRRGPPPNAPPPPEPPKTPDTAAWNLRFLGVDVTELAIYWGLTSDYDACKSVGARTAWMPGPTPRQVKRAGQRHALRMASKSRPCHLGMTWFDRCLYVPASLLGLRFYILLLDLLRNLLLGLTWCTVFASMIACPLYSAFWAASILPWWLSIALVSFGLDYAVAGLFYTRFTVAHGQYYARVAVAYGLYFLVVSALRALVFAAPAFDFLLQPLTGLRCVYHLVVIHGATILSLLNTCLRRCWIGLALRAPLLMPRAAALCPRRTKLSWMCETDLKVDALIAARHAATAARADAAAAAFSDADFDIDRPVRGLPVQGLSMASLLSDISVLAQPFTVSLDRVPSFVPTLCPIGEECAPRTDVRSCIAARVIQSAWRERERMIDRMIECENNFRVSSWCSGCMYRLLRPVRARRVTSLPSLGR